MRQATARNAMLASALAGFAAIAMGGDDADSKPQGALQAIKAADITAGKVEIRGLLGVPLGTMITVTAVVVDDDPKTKQEDPTLRIISVNGEKLQQPISVEYKLWNSFDKKKLVLGRKLRLRVYETGEYVGAPDAAMEESPPIAEVGYTFLTHAEIVRFLPETVEAQDDKR